MKRALRWALAALAVPLAIVALFLATAWIGSSISRNAGWTEPSPDTPDSVEIMVATNGVHTELVLPIVTPQRDWRATFPSAGRPRADGRIPTHIAVGWGEREVFLNVPTWGDLRLATVWRIATSGGEGLVRIGHYVHPAPSAYYRPLRLRPEEYERLARRVEAVLPPLPPGKTRRTYRGFMPEDVNYDAAGKYTLANTCNQWTADTLAAAGVEMGAWTPLAGGVMKWIDEPQRLDNTVR